MICSLFSHGILDLAKYLGLSCHSETSGPRLGVRMGRVGPGRAGPDWPLEIYSNWNGQALCQSESELGIINLLKSSQWAFGPAHSE